MRRAATKAKSIRIRNMEEVQEEYECLSLVGGLHLKVLILALAA